MIYGALLNNLQETRRHLSLFLFVNSWKQGFEPPGSILVIGHGSVLLPDYPSKACGA